MLRNYKENLIATVKVVFTFKERGLLRVQIYQSNINLKIVVLLESHPRVLPRHGFGETVFGEKIFRSQKVVGPSCLPLPTVATTERSIPLHSR